MALSPLIYIDGYQTEFCLINAKLMCTILNLKKYKISEEQMKCVAGNKNKSFEFVQNT